VTDPTPDVPDAVARQAAAFRARFPRHALIFRLPACRIVYVPGCAPRAFTTLGAEEIARDLIATGRRVAVCDPVDAAPPGAAVGRVADGGGLVDPTGGAAGKGAA
jgi:putative component of membrane protein insertase Oxa1/YidC/SpoIIIJ protein YidD